MDLLVTATLEPVTAVPRDRVSNGYVFRFGEAADVPTGAELDTLMAEVAGIYNGGGSTSDSLAISLGPQIVKASSVHALKTYDITGKLLNRGKEMVRGKLREQGPPPHGSPIRQMLFSIPNTGGTDGLPDEVAVCCTLRGTSWDTVPIETSDGLDGGTEIDRPRQRHSGRLYFGPLSASAKTMVSSIPRVSTNTRAQIIARLDSMESATSGAGFAWSIWSRQNGSLFEVERLEVDDEFDTQRRRGKRATLRQVATA